MSNDTQRIVDDVIQSRRSVRAFLPTPVPQEALKDLLQVAARAPSGTNVQPWKVYVLTGEAKEALSNKILAAFNDPEEAQTHTEEYPYYPAKWISPYIERRRKVGLDLYSLLGIQKGDGARMQEQHGRNYKFFDAPVGLIFTIDRIMQQGSWFDYGMFVQTVMLAARARGLDTCPQAAFTQFHRIIEEQLNLPENEMVVCGMALGYADESKPENQLRTERAPLEDWVKFIA
ncbi:nitroreductase [Azospira sp. I13]|uniref:nitroreductase n=1 Tax=Azospira sp. I13 TaxID=1765050 RepID=UPI000D459F2E|nr:nitroreductase [Azospira sp. I13]GBG03435.1 nitroreductase [Azospira sp. I13]